MAQEGSGHQPTVLQRLLGVEAAAAALLEVLAGALTQAAPVLAVYMAVGAVEVNIEYTYRAVAARAAERRGLMAERAQSASSGPVALDHSHQHERQTNNIRNRLWQLYQALSPRLTS